MLLNEEQACQVGQKILKMTDADDVVVNIDHSREALTRIANNSIVLNVFTERHSASVTVSYGKQSGSSSCDSFDTEDLQAMVKRAEDVARVSPADPEHMPSLGPQDYLDVNGHFESTASLDAEARARLAIELIAPSKAAGYRCAGTVETSESAKAVMTKNGLVAYHPSTGAQVGCTVTAPNSTGWARDVTVDISRIDAKELAEAAVRQAKQSADAQRVEPGKYKVVLMPAAAGHLAEYLLWWANARTTHEGLTFLSDHLGKKLAGDDITIYSDPTDPRMPTCPFDGEGVPRQKVTWIDKGMFNQLWWDRWTAHTHNVAPVPHPVAPIMLGTEHSAADLISTVERGILVTHFWYVRTVKDDQTLVTGMTRDGTFLIEDGKVKHGVKNMRFNESCLGMLQRTVGIGKPGSCADVELMPSLFPALVVEDWNFVAATDF